MLSKIIDKIKYKLLLSKIKPEIIGYMNSENSGVSNMTHISNRQNVFIGKNVFIGHFNYIDGFRKIVIEEGCQITNHVSIISHSSHNTIRLQYLNKVKSTNGLDSGEVFIGKNTYIGANAVIMPGTKIGKGSIVSAFSFVKGDFPDYSILRGQPARVIGSTKDIDAVFLEKNSEYLEFYYDK
jgi:acetyltransferase-like isoleucine patch superfamily enzyme